MGISSSTGTANRRSSPVIVRVSLAGISVKPAAAKTAAAATSMARRFVTDSSKAPAAESHRPSERQIFKRNAHRNATIS